MKIPIFFVLGAAVLLDWGPIPAPALAHGGGATTTGSAANDFSSGYTPTRVHMDVRFQRARAWSGGGIRSVTT